MSRREVGALVYDVASACRRVSEYAAGLSRESFLVDRKTRDAVERQLLIAGEAVVQLGKLDRALAERLGPIDEITGFRNILVHAYFRVDVREVWTIVQVHVPRLLGAAETILAALPPPDAAEET